MPDLTLHRVPYAHIYADLSYKDFFERYYPHKDGRLYAATYSFNAAAMDFWWRFEPTSTLYIDSKYTDAARQFLRRFPLFEIRIVSRLHTKAVFFERSGVLLLGSENIYEPNSTFFETSLETVVPENERSAVIDLIFGRLNGRVISAKYMQADIRIHGPGSHLHGKPFLPCHREQPYWDIIGPVPSIRPPQDSHEPPAQDPPQYHPRWVYHVKEYNVNGHRFGLAFDRSYTYCGDLDETALDWLLGNCRITETRPGSGPISQSDDTFLKDRFYKYHPFAKAHTAIHDHWIDGVPDPIKFSDIAESLPANDG